MTHDKPKLLDVLPTSTTSPYFRGSLHTIFNGLFKDGKYDNNKLRTDEDVLFACQAQLMCQVSGIQNSRRLAEEQPSGDREQTLARAKMAERYTRTARINLEALNIGSFIAQLVEKPTRDITKGIHLPLLGADEHNDSLDIYARLWCHLGTYANELNSSPNKVFQSYVSNIADTNLMGHLEGLKVDEEHPVGPQVAQLGALALFGVFQGNLEMPVAVKLSLEREPTPVLVTC